MVTYRTNRPRDYVMESELTLTPQQSMWESILETTVQMSSGFVVSYLILKYLVPIFWSEYNPGYVDAFGITMLFTVTSFLRSLIWRRFFNAELHMAIHKLVRTIIS